MGKTTGFIEYTRQKEAYIPAPERVKNYKEFVLVLENEKAKTQAARCMNCGTPF